MQNKNNKDGSIDGNTQIFFACIVTQAVGDNTWAYFFFERANGLMDGIVFFFSCFFVKRGDLFHKLKEDPMLIKTFP